MRSWRCAGIVCLLLVLARGASAGSWHTGARVGMNMATLRGDFLHISEPGWRPSASAGAFIEGNLAAWLSVGLEVQYMQKGATFTQSVTDAAGNVISQFESDLMLEYVEVPMLFRLKIASDDAVVPYFVGGPTFGFAVHGTFQGPGFTDSDLLKNMKAMDAGGTIGLGIRIPLDQARMDVEARYEHGLGDLWDISNNKGSMNEGVLVTIGVSR